MQSDSIAGRYRVVRAVGKGGMGTVWLCDDETLHRQVAVKQIRSLPGRSPGDAARAMREARLSASLNHENAVSIYDVVEHDDSTWLVMEYVPSRTLSRLLADEGPLVPRRAARIGAQVASALTQAHALGIVHRDVKPGNILIADDDVAKISDFGIARGHQDVRLTQTGMISGTAAYFAPELARGEDPTFASDVWALGITLYDAVEGVRPHESQMNSLAMLTTILQVPLRPPRQAGPLGRLLQEMLEREPGRRPSMPDVLEQLRFVVRSEQTPTAGRDAEPHRATPSAVESAEAREPVGPVGSSPVPRQRRSLRLLMAAALTLVLLAGAGVLVWSKMGAGDVNEPTAAEPPKSAEPTGGSTSPRARGNDRSPAGHVASASGAAGFTRSYYKLMPDDLDRGWRLIAPSMRTELGRQSYQDFWNSVEAVSLGSVEAVDDKTVQYRIRYKFSDGRVSRETKRLTLRPNGDSYLITDDTTVG